MMITLENKKESKWYVLKVFSGQENKIKAHMDIELKRSGMDKVVTQVLIPTEKVYQIKAGKKVVKEKTLFPGYLYIEVAPPGLNSEIVAELRSLPNVMNFLGGKDNKPEPLRNSEVQKLFGKFDEITETGEVNVEPYIINETVKIIDGPFNEFSGTIEEIFEEKKKLKVIVKIFGRRTPVEVNFVQVEKVS